MSRSTIQAVDSCSYRVDVVERKSVANFGSEKIMD